MAVDNITLVKSFPFDSNPDSVTDVNGYLSGDRSVDAWTMQNTFAQFFSDGIFGTPGNALEIAKASSGLAVTIQPGMFIIKGGMGGILDSDGPVTVTLDSGAAAGNVCYGVMLRYDNNPDMRSLGIRIAKGTPGADPQPPAPDQTSANVYELRLGYVRVPNGATDLSNATVTNEKGTSVCPYAAPFVPIDLTGVTEDARRAAQEALAELADYIEANKGLVESALDGTTAGYLQEQINSLQQYVKEIDLEEQVDDITIEYTNSPTSTDSKLRVKDGGINKVNLSKSLQVELGILDTADFTFQDFYDACNGADIETQQAMMTLATSEQVNSWAPAQISLMCGILDNSAETIMVGKITQTTVQGWGASDLAAVLSAVSDTDKTTIENLIPQSEYTAWTVSEIQTLFPVLSDSMQAKYISSMDLNAHSWSDISAIKAVTSDGAKGGYLNKTKNETFGGIGQQKMHVCGIDFDDLADGTGKAGLTFSSSSSSPFYTCDGYTNQGLQVYKNGNGQWPGTGANDYTAFFWPYMPAALQAAIKPVTKLTTQGHQSADRGETSGTFSIWLPSFGEDGGNTGDGPKYPGTLCTSVGSAYRTKGGSGSVMVVQKTGGSSGAPTAAWNNIAARKTMNFGLCFCI